MDFPLQNAVIESLQPKSNKWDERLKNNRIKKDEEENAHAKRKHT